MRVMFKGLTGSDVGAWQAFLRGFNKKSVIHINNVFDEFTKLETQTFQSSLPGQLNADGIVGNTTYAKAMKLGLNVLVDEREDESGASWPMKPVDTKQLSTEEKEKIFGRFSYVAAPTSQNPEAIKITDDWVKKNIVYVNVPQLKLVQYAPKGQLVQFHAKAAVQLQRVFKNIDDAGLLNKVLTFGGTWVPRFIRGSTTKLSNHATGCAIDLNVPWNALGTVGALKGRPGNTRELVAAFYDAGFFWGGWFDRCDPMHFEINRCL